jgi:GAF domain-containing protein
MSVLGRYLGISTGAPEETVLRLLIELGAQFAGAQEGSLLVVDEQRADLVFAMTVGRADGAESLVGQRVPLGEGLVGLAAQTQEVQIGAPKFDVPGATEHSGTKSSAPRAVLAAPMLIGDRLIGVITAVSFADDKRFGSDDARLYGRIATVAGVVVDQHRRLAAVEALERNETPPAAISEDERTDLEIVAAIGRLVRARPGAKPRIAQLLGLVESLVAE